MGAVNSLKEDGSCSDMEIISYISLIFAYLIKNNLIYNYGTKSKDEQFCANLMKYIYGHYTENISSSDAAAALSYNHSYFCRIFKRNFRKNFSEYLNIYRIAMSRILLEQKNNSITEIAHMCGFNSCSYFSKCFKKYIGILPSKYYKNLEN